MSMKEEFDYVLEQLKAIKKGLSEKLLQAKSFDEVTYLRRERNAMINDIKEWNAQLISGEHLDQPLEIVTSWGNAQTAFTIN